MEAVISAIAGELVSRIISVLTKYTEKTAIDDKLERLQQLLLRIHTVVEEADGRYITNPTMLMQLKLLVASMYRGYHVLDIFRYKFLVENLTRDEDSTTSSSSPLKRSRSIFPGTMRIFFESNDLPSVLENLEDAIANMTEFVVLLGGCERMHRRPFDTYLYIDNFMFGRHVEKQQIINILLQDLERHGRPMVLPVIGGMRVGKKTLVSHACRNDRIRSHFPSILFINGDSIRRMDDGSFSRERTSVVVEFVADVDDGDWINFYSTLSHNKAQGSKLIIISRIQNLARFGTVKPITLKSLSHEEYRYLYKMLAFGSTDEHEYPQLASLVNKLATVMGGSLVPANFVADLLRRNLDLQYWLQILRRFKLLVDYNLSKSGKHLKDIHEEGQPIDITPLISSYPASLRVMSTVIKTDLPPGREPPQVALGDLLAGCGPLPHDEFMVVMWESRVPPYTKTVCAVACAPDEHGCTPSGRKRRSN